MTDIRRIIAGTVVMTLAAAPAAGQWVDESNRHATRVLEMQGEFAPEGVSAQGLSRFDGEVVDLRSGFRERRSARIQALVDELRQTRTGVDDPRVHQDLSILDRRARGRTGDVGHQVPPSPALLQCASAALRRVQPSARPPDRRPAIRCRFGATPQIHRPDRGLRSDRRSRHRANRGAVRRGGLLGPFRGQVEADLDNAPRLTAGLRRLFERSG